MRSKARGEGPTLATRRKLSPDPVRRLLDSGKFSAHQAQACDEIRKIFRFFATRLGPAARDYTKTLPVGRGRRFLVRQPLDGMRRSLSEAYERHFRPWSRRMAERPAVRSNVAGFSCFDLVVAVVVDERSLRSLEREVGIRNGALTAKLKEALDAYG